MRVAMKRLLPSGLLVLWTIFLFSVATSHSAKAAAFTPKAIGTAPLILEGAGGPFKAKAFTTEALQMIGNYTAPR